MVHWTSVPRSDNVRDEQDSLQEFPGSDQGRAKTYDNRTGELQLSQRTIYREGKCHIAEPRMTSGHRAEPQENYGGCPHEGKEGGDENEGQGRLYAASDRERDGAWAQRSYRTEGASAKGSVLIE